MLLKLAEIATIRNKKSDDNSQYNMAIKIVMEGTDEGYLLSSDEFLRVLNSKLMGIRNSNVEDSLL